MVFMRKALAGAIDMQIVPLRQVAGYVNIQYSHRFAGQYVIQDSSFRRDDNRELPWIKKQVQNEKKVTVSNCGSGAFVGAGFPSAAASRLGAHSAASNRRGFAHRGFPAELS